MTHPDDRDDAGQAHSEDSGLPYDEDALWRAIVENYGERPEMGADPLDLADPVEPPAPTPPVRPATPSSGVFDRSYLDAAEAARDAAPDPAPDGGTARDSWSEEGHFVPPDPPPLPRTTPARLLAWIGLFGAPLLMLLAVVFAWTFPVWLAMMLVVGFVGGFVFLVATMSRDRGDWPGDDGAVV